MASTIMFRGQIIFPDRIERGMLVVKNGRIAGALDPYATIDPESQIIDVADGYIAR